MSEQIDASRRLKEQGSDEQLPELYPKPEPPLSNTPDLSLNVPTQRVRSRRRTLSTSKQRLPALRPDDDMEDWGWLDDSFDPQRHPPGTTVSDVIDIFENSEDFPRRRRTDPGRIHRLLTEVWPLRMCDF